MNRYYDSSLGRFISEDPVKDGVNWYVYEGNNPEIYYFPIKRDDEECVN
jgi:RHS repeat-associated protein